MTQLKSENESEKLKQSWSRVDWKLKVEIRTIVLLSLYA